MTTQVCRAIDGLDFEENTMKKIEIAQVRNDEATIGVVNQINNSEDRLMCEIVYNGIFMEALIDTGSPVSLIDSSVVDSNGWEVQTTSANLTGITGTKINLMGSTVTTIEVTLGNVKKSIEQRFNIAKNIGCKFLMGLKLMSKLEIVLDTATKAISYSVNKINGITAKKTVEIKPRSMQCVEAEADTVGLIETKAFNGEHDLLIANFINLVQDRHLELLVANLDTNPCIINAGDKLADFEEVNEIMVNRVNEGKTQLKNSKEWLYVGTKLTNTQLQELKNILDEYAEAFSLQGELGECDAAEHKIELLLNAKPHAEPLRRRPQFQIEETRKQVKDMLKKGIIEEADGPWAADYVIIKKKTGDYRLCVDFRRLNNSASVCA